MKKQRANEMEDNIKDIISDLDNLDVKVTRNFSAIENAFKYEGESLEKIFDSVLQIRGELGVIGMKLDRVLAYIDKVESPQYQQALDNKEILINLLANAVITRLFAMFNNGQNQMQ